MIRLKLISVALSALFLAACSDDDEPQMMEIEEMMEEVVPVTSTYEVTVQNLTYGQPLSPIAAVLHDEGQLWMIGESASEALEKLAEAGDASDVLALPVVLASAQSEGIVMPGMSTTFSISIDDNAMSNISLASMLVNTNDAFTGLNKISLAELEVGTSWTSFVGVYDAGTESNSEASGSIPGPADGGTGFDMERDDTDFVSMHPGVVTQDDGLMTSVLTQAHKFDQPVAYITITRTE